MPGLVEAHLHLFPGAFGVRLLQLEGVQGLSALRDKLQTYAKENPDEGLLICKAADYNLFGEGVQTTRQMLDEALADRPLILLAADHHTAWANTIALEQAGILGGRELSPGNEIVMADDGFAAGELREPRARRGRARSAADQRRARRGHRGARRGAAAVRLLRVHEPAQHGWQPLSTRPAPRNRKARQP